MADGLNSETFWKAWARERGATLAISGLNCSLALGAIDSTFTEQLTALEIPFVFLPADSQAELEADYLRAIAITLSHRARFLGQQRVMMFSRSTGANESFQSISEGIVHRFIGPINAQPGNLPVSEHLSLSNVLSRALAKPIRKGIESGIRSKIYLEQVASEIHRLLRIPGTRSRAIFDLVSALGLIDIKHLLAVYQDRYQADLIESVAKHTSGLGSRRVLAFLEGRRAEASALSIYFAIKKYRYRRSHRLLTNAVYNSLKQLPRGTRRQVRTLLLDCFARPNLPNYLPPHIAEALELMLRGSATEALFACYLDGLKRGDLAALLELVRETSPTELLRLCRFSQQQRGVDLVVETTRRFGSSISCELVVSYLGGEVDNISALELELALRRSSESWIGDFFRGKPTEERERLVAVYNNRFQPKTFAQELAQRVFWRDAEIISDLVAFGSVSPGKLLWFCLAGFGTDEDGICDILAALSPTERVTAISEFRNYWVARAPIVERLAPNLFGDFCRRARFECSGDAWCDISAIIKDSNLNPTERVIDLYGHERSGPLLKQLLRVLREGAVMERDVSSLLDPGFHTVDFNDQPHKRLLLSIAEFSCRNFRHVKHAVGNQLTALGAGCCCLLVTAIVPIYLANLTTIMICVGFTSIASRIAIKTLIKGSGYHKNEKILDLVFGAIDGITLLLSQLFRHAVLKSGSRMAGKAGINKSVRTLLRRFRHVSTDSLHLSLDELFCDEEDSFNVPNSCQSPHLEFGHQLDASAIRDIEAALKEFSHLVIDPRFFQTMNGRS